MKVNNAVTNPILTGLGHQQKGHCDPRQIPTLCRGQEADGNRPGGLEGKGQTQKCRAGEILRPPPDVPPPSGSVGNGKRILLAGVQVGAAPSTLSECPERTRPTRPSLRGGEPPRPLREQLCTPEARDAYGNPERAHLLCPAKVWGPFHRDATPAPRWAGSVSPSCPGSPFQSSWHCWQLTLRRNTDFKALEANSSQNHLALK